MNWKVELLVEDAEKLHLIAVYCKGKKAPWYLTPMDYIVVVID